MVAEFGYGILAGAVLLSIYAAVAAVYGGLKHSPRWTESARSAALSTFPLVSLSAFGLIYLLVYSHYEVAYVYSVTSNSMPAYLKITALWGGQSGSLLFWSWLMAGFTFAALLRKWDRDREFLPWVTAVTMITLAFFLLLVVFYENPFVRYWETAAGEPIKAMFQPLGAVLVFPQDGSGLNPLLRHPGMIVHPPALYLGFVSFVIPYAFAVAALITGRTDDRWIRLTRRWTLVAWFFLSMGLVLGMRWAYDVLGWGGYWGWDPVEISALMPWLTGTAFLHSVMIQEKRGMMKQWNMVLIILTYALVIFGTFLTRSGVLSSVHSFALSAIGPLFFVFIAVTSLVSAGLLLYRWDRLKAEGSLTSLLSRESLFLFNNLLFMGILVVCFWGVIFPLLSELVTGQQVTVGPDFYKRATGPLFAALLLLMGIAPLSVWGSSAQKSMGKAIWKPLVFSLLVVGIALVLGVRSIAALAGFWVCALTAAVTLVEYGAGVWVRHKVTGESLPAAFWNLPAHYRRRYGGYIIHLGIVLMGLGIIGMDLFQTQTQGTIRKGESLLLQGYSVTFQSLSEFDTPDGRNVSRAELEVSKNGRKVGELYPRRDYYYEAQQSMTIPGLRSTMEDDLYVILVDWQAITPDQATFKVFHNPLVNWLWVGSLILVLGSLVAGWPEREKQPGRGGEKI